MEKIIILSRFGARLWFLFKFEISSKSSQCSEWCNSGLGSLLLLLAHMSCWSSAFFIHPNHPTDPFTTWVCKIRLTTLLNYIKSADPLILRLKTVKGPVGQLASLLWPDLSKKLGLWINGGLEIRRIGVTPRDGIELGKFHAFLFRPAPSLFSPLFRMKYDRFRTMHCSLARIFLFASLAACV